MNSIRQIAIQLPEGLQRLQLHLFANGLVGWSPQAEDMETALPGVDTTADQATQTRSPRVNLRHALDRLDVNASEDNQTDDGQESDHFADVDSEAGSDSESNERNFQQQSHGMTDEEQIAAVQAFIVGDDTLNPSLQEAAWMAATQLVSSLADPSEYLEAEVRLHTIEGGLQLKIGQGIMARSIYIYGDDEASEADDEQFYHDTEEDEDVVRGALLPSSPATQDAFRASEIRSGLGSCILATSRARCDPRRQRFTMNRRRSNIRSWICKRSSSVSSRHTALKILLWTPSGLTSNSAKKDAGSLLMNLAESTSVFSLLSLSIIVSKA
ncbi:MAG: hypothetical protein FRX49_04593 [Trebouxia sp. A1-2]|nr:MAG: hypothetical protein FRX49_04593 [Trebouxia sp. A1-2]